MSWSGFSPERDKTFEDYYEQAHDELVYYDGNAWGGSPSKAQIRDRAAQLALGDNSVDYDEYESQMQAAQRGYPVGAWEADPTEAQLIANARSYLSGQKSDANQEGFEQKHVEEIKQPTSAQQDKNETKLTINAPQTLFHRQIPQKKAVTLNMLVISNRIQQCSTKYLSWGLNKKIKFSMIQDALKRAVEAFENNPQLNLNQFLMTRFANKPSLKDAFEYARIFGKSDAFGKLHDLLRFDPVEVLVETPPGGLALV